MSKLILPGLIDPHVHLRDPGQTHKEDFFTGTSAALAGGYTTVIDMPNNKIPITTKQKLDEKIKIAKEKIVCDVGFYFGSLGNNLEEFKKVGNKVLGLKLYLNETTGNFLIDKKQLEQIFIAWNKSMSLHSSILFAQKPILLHAEDDAVEYVIKLAEKLGNKIHFCHISTSSDLKQIIKAKEKGIKVSCGVTPHHLFLNEDDVKTLGPFGKMKPPLRPKTDVNFLWKNLKFIDAIESDHAPHTISEKLGVAREEGLPTPSNGAGSALSLAGLPAEALAKAGGNRVTGPLPSPFGVPGLETTLPLLLTAASQNKLKIEDIVRLCHTNPAKIFGIKTDPTTKIEVNPNSSFIINNSSLLTKCGWSPFNGWEVKGKVERVFIRGKKVFEDGKLLVRKGSGKILIPSYLSS